MAVPDATDVDIAFFAEHGWIVVEDAIDPADLATLEQRCDEIIANKETMAFDWAWEKGTDRDEREFKILQGSPSHGSHEFDDAPFRTWAVEFGSALLGRRRRVLVRPVPRQASAAAAPRRSGTRTRPTGAATSTRRASRAGCRSTTSTSSNGCMHFIDRGHLDGVLEHAPPGARPERPPVLHTRRVADRRLPDLARQRDVPPRQDAPHDHGQRDRISGGGS